MKKLLLLVFFPGFLLAAIEEGVPSGAPSTVAPGFNPAATEELMGYARGKRIEGGSLKFVRAQLEAGADPNFLESRFLTDRSPYNRALKRYDLGVLTLLLAFGCNPNMRNLDAPGLKLHSPISGILLGEDRDLDRSLAIVELLIMFGLDVNKVYYSTALIDAVRPRAVISLEDISSRVEAVKMLLDNGADQGHVEACEIVRTNITVNEKDLADEAKLEGLGNVEWQRTRVAGLKNGWTIIAEMLEQHTPERQAEVRRNIAEKSGRPMLEVLRSWAERGDLMRGRYEGMLEVLSYPTVIQKLQGFRPYEVKPAS